MSVENNIPKGWEETTLVAVVESANTGLDAIKRAPIVDEETGIKCFRIQDASQKKEYKDWGNTKVEDKNYEKFKLVKGDILIARTGNSIGVHYLVKSDLVSVFNNGLIRLRTNAKANYEFIYKIIESNNFDRYVQSIAYGTSTQPNMQINVLLGFDLLLPPIKEQVAIAKILTAFDDKIELLQAQNKTLETTAQTIFKEWFGKYQIGDELPDGWRVGKLGEIAEFLNGLALQKFPPISGEETLPVIKIRELKQGITSITDKANTNLDKKYIINNGDVLFSWSGSLDVVIWQYGKGALNQHLFKVTSENHPKWFYYFWILHHLREFRGVASDKATTMGHINRKHLDLAEVIIPSKESFKELNNLFIPLIEKMENNAQQIQTIKQTRDILLPKLMSGTLRVNEFKENAV